MIDELYSIGVLPSSKRLLSLLISNKGFGFIDIVTFTVSESQMVSLIGLVPHGREQVRNHQVEELGHVNDVEEFRTIADIEPHPVTIGLQADGFKTQELEEVRSKTISKKQSYPLPAHQ